MILNSKKIGLFLKSINATEFIYLGHVVNMRNNIEHFVKRYKLTKKDICFIFKINPNKYENFIKGNYNYSVMDMSRLDAAYIELETKKLKETNIIKVTENK